MKRRSSRPAGEHLESRALMATFVVTSAAGAGPGTLRAAINLSNQSPGADAIVFQVPSNATISVGNPPLPPITGQVVIDGYTQAGSARNTSTDPAVNNARLGVELLAGGGSAPLLQVNPRGSGSQIRGISFKNTGSHVDSGVAINQASNVTIDGNAFGANGQSRLGAAVKITGGSRNTIGGDVAADPGRQNVMSMYTNGVELSGPSSHNAVVGNIIGGVPAESRAPLQEIGVWLKPSASNNTIIRNVMYRNIEAFRDESFGNVIEGNTIVPR